jgi:transcriptional regulator with XRE-family HTH domain
MAVMGRLLRELRQAKGMRQADVAARLGRPQQYVANVEAGGQRLDLWELRRVCEALGVELTDFIRRFERAT